MAEKQRDAVKGYIKLNYGKSIIDGISDIIYDYYVIKMESIIMNDDEQYSLIISLLNEFKKNDVKHIDTELLYRASDNKYSSRIFHDICDEQSNTITIMRTDQDYVFGGFASKPWSTKEYARIVDENAFLFGIRPKLGVYKSRRDHVKPTIAKHGLLIGPIFGDGWDLYVDNTANGKDCHGASTPATFDFDPKEVLGVDHDPSYQYHFTVVDYEVFSLIYD